MRSNDEPSGFEFDVALSFAGEDRTYVESVAHELGVRGIRCFFDEDNVVEMWGTDLYVYLDEVYRRKSRYAVIFVSRHYVDKPWPSHERQSIQARAFQEKLPYLLPIRLDDSELPGLRPTIGYLDARTISSNELADAIVKKVGGPDTRIVLPPPPTPRPRTPRSREELTELLGQRPPGWEHLMFAGVLLQRRNELEDKFRDHELRHATRTGRLLTDSETRQILDTAFSDASALGDSINRILDPAVQERAFGLPGEPGDPDRINQMSRRLMDVYDGFMDWAAEVRGTRVPERFRNAFELAAQFVDQPIAEYRAFVDHVLAQMERVANHLIHPESAEPLRINLTLKLTIDERTIKAFNREMRRLR